MAIPNTPTGSYRHVILVFRGGRTIDYYENGALINSVSDASPNPYAWINPINVGKVLDVATGAPLGFYDGSLQGFAVYNFALNPSMVANHFAAATHAPTTNNGQVQLVHPLPFVPNAGDAFLIYPGCDKTRATCTTKFGNRGNYGGEDLIPVPEQGL
jgi:hypothetical protein